MFASPLFHLSAGAAMALAATAAGAAQTYEEPFTVVGRSAVDESMRILVSYTDLDLTEDAEARQLGRRVGAASRQVCAHYDFASIRYDASIACAAKARADAAPQVAAAIANARSLAETGVAAAPIAAIAVTARTR